MSTYTCISDNHDRVPRVLGLKQLNDLGNDNRHFLQSISNDLRLYSSLKVTVVEDGGFDTREQILNYSVEQWGVI